MLTVWKNGIKRTGAVSIIIGACGQEERWLSESKRWFYFDAHLDALDGPYDSDVIPRVSANLNSVTKWRGKGDIPKSDFEKLMSLVEKAHTQNRKVRFWGASNNPKVWKTLIDAGVDWINVDRLSRFDCFTNE
jgi:glycerophosphoryl diester phosphodiesterase